MATKRTPARKADDYSQPEAAQKAQTAAGKREKEVKDIQIDTHHDNVSNVPSDAVETAFGAQPKSDKPVALTFVQVGQEVIVSLENREIARFGREDWLGVVRHVNKIGSSL